MLDESKAIAARHRFLHWPLTFPDVFANDGSLEDRPPGFDAIIGNPPWDMVRGDSGVDEAKAGRRVDARQMTDFVRESGIYKVESRAHLNLYQLFVERALQLVRPGGRIGFVVPSGLVSDAGAAPLRRHLLDRAEVDDITGLDNRLAIFPVHRSVRFVLLTCTTGRETTASAAGSVSPASTSSSAPRAPRSFCRGGCWRGCPGMTTSAFPELASETDLAIVEAVSNAAPRLGGKDGWNVEFGRELNASDDRESFTPIAPHSTGRPVIEGKQIDAFRVAVGEAGWRSVTLRGPACASRAVRGLPIATSPARQTG